MWFQWLCLSVGVTSACSVLNISTCTLQWAETVLDFSTQGDYNAVASILNASDDNYWEPESSYAHLAHFPEQFLHLGFSQELWVVAVGIQETDGNGATVQIAAKSTNLTTGGFVELWSGLPTTPYGWATRYFLPNITCTMRAQSVLLVVRTDVTNYVPGIDAVGMHASLTKPSWLPVCNFPSVCTLTYCKHNGKCIASGLGLSCVCKEPYYGNNCELLRPYPIALGNVTFVPQTVASLMLGEDDGKAWSFWPIDPIYRPPYVFAEFVLPIPLYVHGFRVTGQRAAEVTNLFVLSPQGYWQQVWEGVATDIDEYIEVNVTCSTPFLTSAVRFHTMTDQGGKIDSIQVQGREDFPAPGNNCTNRCGVSPCYQSRCISGGTSLSCACLSSENISWSGDKCEVAQVYSNSGALIGGYTDQSSTPFLITLPLGYQTVDVGYPMSLYFSGYSINSPDANYDEVFVSAGNNEWMSVWHNGSSFPIENMSALCQPNVPVNQMSIAFSFPLQCSNCGRKSVVSMRLQGTLSINQTLPICANPCASHMCMNNASCYGHANNTFRCQCTAGFGGRYCGIPKNWATALIDHSFSGPAQLASAVLGPPDEYLYDYAHEPIWKFPEYDISDPDLTRERDTMDLQFNPVNATALQLYEWRNDGYRGLLSNILIFVATPFPHYEEVLLINETNGDGVRQRFYTPSWSCRPTGVTSRVRLEWTWFWNPVRYYTVGVDAVRLFSVEDGPSLLPPVCTNACTNASFCGVGGYCASRGTQASCICFANYTGINCEFKAVWASKALASSSIHDNDAASRVVGAPEQYPEIDWRYESFAIAMSQWMPLYSISWLEVEFATVPAFIHAFDIYHAGEEDTALTSILAQTQNLSFVEIWSGQFFFNSYFQRAIISVANFSCHPGRINKVRFEFTGTLIAIDAIKMIYNDSAPTAPASCAVACSPNPCLNEGVCVHRLNASLGDKCECKNGYSGPLCATGGLWWANEVRDVSSAYFDTFYEVHFYPAYGAQNLVGEPSALTGTPETFRFEASDNQTLFGLGTIEYMEVAFPSPVYLSDNGVRVIEVNNSGAIVRILARATTGGQDPLSPLVVIWTRPNNYSYSAPFQPYLTCRPAFAVDSIRIEVDINQFEGFESYDGVAVIGSLLNDITTPLVPVCNFASQSLCDCLNDGICVLSQTGKTCACDDMWRGQRCELPSLLATRSFNQKSTFLTYAEDYRVLCIIHLPGDMVCYNQTSPTISIPPPQNSTWIQVVTTEYNVCLLDREGYVSCYAIANGTFVATYPDRFYSISGSKQKICGITREFYLQCLCNYSIFYCPSHRVRKYVSLSSALNMVAAVTRAGQVDFFSPNDIPLYAWTYSDSYEPVELSAVGGLGTAVYCFILKGEKIQCEAPYGPSDVNEMGSLASGYNSVSINDGREACGVTLEGQIRCRNSLVDVFNVVSSAGLSSGFPNSLMYVGILGTQSGPYYNWQMFPQAFCALISNGSVVCNISTSVDTKYITQPARLVCDYLNGGCSPFASCANVPSGAKCTCLPGFSTVVLSPFFSDCVDIDECDGVTTPCLPGETCVNNPGSFECRSRSAVIYAAIGCGGISNESGVPLPIRCSTSGQDEITMCGSEIVAGTSPLVYSLAENGGRCPITKPYRANEWLNKTVNGQYFSFFCPQIFSFRVPEGSGTRLKLELPGANVTPALFYSYAPPFVSDKSGCTTNCSRDGFPRPILTLHGVNFGSRPHVFIGGQACDVLNTSQTSIACVWPVGHGFNSPVVVLAGDQTANAVFVSYTPCPLGTEIEVNGTRCLPCREGFVRSDFGLEMCTLCGVGKFANTKRTECDDCGSKTGLSCSGGVASALANYWGYSTSQDFIIMRCPPNHCLGNGQCSPGREPASTNLLCAACTPPLAVWGNECMPCEHTNGSLLFGLIILFELFFLFAHLTSKRDRKAGMTKLMVYFVQIALVLAGVAEVHLNFLQIFMFDLASASIWSSSCLFPMKVEAQVGLALFMPVWLLLIVLFNFAVQKILYAILPRWRYVENPETDRYFRTCLTMLVFAYSATCTRVFQLLECVNIEGAGSVLLSYPTIDCDGGFYEAFRPIVILMLAVYILGFPIGCVALLAWWKRKRVLGVDDDSHKALNYRWGVWYMAYRPSAFYWQSVELLRRFGFAIINHLADTSRGLGFSYLNLAALLAQMVVAPYVDPIMNKAELLMHIVLLCLSLLVTSTDGGSVPASWVFFLLVIATVAAGIAYVVFENFKRIRGFFRTRREAALSRKEMEMEQSAEVSKLPRTASAMGEF